ncbi:MAG: hypothetical protein OHK0039_04060 [Bacteroidia bacterium]
MSRLFVALAFVLAFTLSACQRETTDEIAESEVELAELDASIEASFDESDAYAFEAMDVTDFSVNARRYVNAADRLINACVTVTHDSINKVVTLDFGTGCVGPDGRTRSGQIVISYTQRLYVPGATLTIDHVNYSVDSVMVAGTRIITNVSPNFQSNISLNTQLVGGMLVWPNGDTATRAFTRTATWMRAVNPINDELHVDGSATGTTRNAVAYTTQTLSTLIFKRSCRRSDGIRVPVEGVVSIQRGSQPKVQIDYGDGTCDRLATLSRNGQTRVITLRNR